MRVATESYADLLAAAIDAATTLVRGTSDASLLSGRAKFIYDRSAELAEALPSQRPVNSGRLGIGYDALDLLVANWENVARGDVAGEALLRSQPQFWNRLMMEWPMGAYVNLAVDFLRSEALPQGKRILEVGAGVGAVARRMPELDATEYVRTDLNPFIAPRDLPGRVALYDFNKKGRWENFDIIFGVNALHCARSPELSVSYLADMLRSGGLLLLAEGQPTTTIGKTPWALTPFFGLFDGWWDIGGFRDQAAWIDDFEAAGLRETGRRGYMSEGHSLGGLVWARKP